MGGRSSNRSAEHEALRRKWPRGAEHAGLRGQPAFVLRRVSEAFDHASYARDGDVVVFGNARKFSVQDDIADWCCGARIRLSNRVLDQHVQRLRAV